LCTDQTRGYYYIFSVFTFLFDYRPSVNIDKEESDSENDDETTKVMINNKEKTADCDKSPAEESEKLINFDWKFLSNVLPSNECTN
jgi:hypothetical protein